MFTPPAIAGEFARYRHRDLVARAERYRLGRCVHQPSTPSGWPRFRASLLRSLLRWRSRAPVPAPDPVPTRDGLAQLATADPDATV
jgi:hypothetical protein